MKRTLRSKRKVVENEAMINKEKQINDLKRKK